MCCCGIVVQNLDFVFNVLLWCYFSRTEMSFSMRCCGVVFQELRCRFQCVVVAFQEMRCRFQCVAVAFQELVYRFQCFAVVLFSNILDVIFNVLLWCYFSRT
jgi:hypothetical protein